MILQFTSIEELDGYLVAVTNLGISVDAALVCANVFFQGRWPQVIALANASN